MIKFIEIFYTDDSQKEWQLREVLINPNHIIKCSPVLDFNEKIKSATNAPSLSSVQEYTRISQTSGISLVVVASIDHINEKINNSKKLLKG